MKKICVVYTTVSTEGVATKLGEEAVNQNLAACVNYASLQSIYRWQGKIEKAIEWSIRFKTTVENAEALVAWVKANHPYELPALWWQVVEASDEYANYLSGIE